MIEKIMKAVKSGNKKRGRNITVGAVVGMLLSCTVVMGADAIGLDIANGDTGIEFDEKFYENTWENNTYTNYAAILGQSNNTAEGIGINIAGNEKETSFTLINNGMISGKSSNGDAYGIKTDKLGDNSNFSFINNGLALGEASSTTDSKEAYGVHIKHLFKNTNPAANITGSFENNGTILGKNINGKAYGVYLAVFSGSDFPFVNNGIISAEASTEACGISLNTFLMSNSTFENNGLISGKGEDSYGIVGIRGMKQEHIKSLTNNGLILSCGTSQSSGVSMSSKSFKTLKNNGLILANNSGTMCDGINISSQYNATDFLINDGLIIAKGGSGVSGIRATTKGIISKLINNGLISSSEIGINDDGAFGIYKIENTGIIYGTTNAIKIGSGITNSAVNYGILVNGSDTDVVTGLSDEFANYGIIIKNVEDGSSTVIAGAAAPKDGVIVGYIDDTPLKRSMTIKNKSDGSSFHGKDSNDNSILNAIGDTYKVTDLGDESDKATEYGVTGSIINAYENAVVFTAKDKKLTLSGTIVNAEVKKDTFAIKGSDGADTLILQSGEITVNGNQVTQNTVINGNINMGAGADTLTIGSGTIINGTLDGGTDLAVGALAGIDVKAENDTLNFGIAGASSSKETKVFYDISNFENINVNSNVTFFEKTTDSDGKVKDLVVTGAKEINISAGGVLNLKIDTNSASDGRYVGHALAGNIGLKINGDTSLITESTTIVESENGTYNVGVLNLVTNGFGLNSIIAMDDISLDDDLFIKTNSILDKAIVLEKEEGQGKIGDIKVEAGKDLKEIIRSSESTGSNYSQLNKIYKGVYSSGQENFNALKDILTLIGAGESYTSVTDREQMAKLLSYLGSIYTETPYSFSSELSRRSAGMFRDIIAENEFRPNQDNWLIMGGLTHADGGTKDTYYGRNYHGFDTGTSDTDADMKLSGAYMLAKYGYSENTSFGLTLGGNKSEAKLDMSKVKGNSGYIGAFAENYRGNLTLKAGVGIQYSEYDADRRTMGGHSYSDKYSDMTYDIYLNGRYSHNIGKDLFLEPYATLSYTYVDQDGANEGSKDLAIETDSKSFDYTVAKAGVDLKKVIPHEKGKSTVSVGVSYTKIIDGADEEHITGRFKGGSDFDILVAHKNEHSIGLNAKYALELENGVIFDVKGTYSVERDSHNQSGKNRTKGEWIVGAGLGYKF